MKQDDDKRREKEEQEKNTITNEIKEFIQENEKKSKHVSCFLF